MHRSAGSTDPRKERRWVLGIFLGISLGWLEGSEEGTSIGTSISTSLGTSLGWLEGSEEGIDDGDLLGTSLGIAEGQDAKGFGYLRYNHSGAFCPQGADGIGREEGKGVCQEVIRQGWVLVRAVWS